MIYSRTFAFGHIPKTGGDAIHLWLRALRDRDLTIDSIDGPWKHDHFAMRPETQGQRFYVSTIARLPAWLLSLLWEDSTHANVVADWGFASAEEMRRPDAAFRHCYGDWHLSRMRQGVEITHWLRSGATLFDDMVATIGDVHRPLEPDEIETMRAARVKRPRPYDHDVRTFWTRQEMETLYRMNPQWAAIEALVFGGNW